jgi:hypothetical protein
MAEPSTPKRIDKKAKGTRTGLVKRYLSQGKSTKEIAKILYGDATEIGQRKVRALISKLKKRFNNNTSNSGAVRLGPVRKLGGCGGVVRRRNPLILLTRDMKSLRLLLLVWAPGLVLFWKEMLLPLFYAMLMLL